MNTRIKKWIVVGLLFGGVAYAQTPRRTVIVKLSNTQFVKGCPMPETIHSWISTTGDGSLPGSWDTGIPPAVGATGTLTLSANAANNETVFIDGSLDSRTYTFKTVLSTGPQIADEVLIGTDKDDSLANLIAAIMLGDGSGTKYGSPTTVNAEVTAAAGATGEMIVTAKSRGTYGNSVNTTETMGAGAWGAATLEDGTQWGEDDVGYFNADNGGVAWTIDLDWNLETTNPQLRVDDNWRFDLGMNGTPLQLGWKKVTWKGTGTGYLSRLVGGIPVIVNSAGGRVVIQDSTILSLTILAGDVVGVDGISGLTIGNIWVLGGLSRLEIDDSGIALTGDIHIRGGSAFLVPVTAADKLIEVTDGGKLDQVGRIDDDGQIIIARGASMRYRPYDATPTTPDVYVDGILDLSKSSVQLTDADFGNAIIGPNGDVIGGAITKDAWYPPDFDLRERWPQ